MEPKQGRKKKRIKRRLAALKSGIKAAFTSNLVLPCKPAGLCGDFSECGSCVFNLTVLHRVL